jgi:hypothetical protein
LLAIRGNFNRTPTVSFEDFIVRIPRDSTVGLKYQVATLKYVETYIGYPVPQVVAFQPSPDKNPLAQGYMIQRRLAGQPLHQIWNNLTFGQKKRAVRQISQILINLNKVRNDSPGICSPSCKLESYPVPAFGISEPKFTKPHIFPSKPITTKDLLLRQCVRRREYEQAATGRSWNEVWDGFESMIHKLHKLNIFPDDDQFHLSHLDLQNRNLLVEVHGDEITMTGILDRDSAIFAPKFMS